jgi:DNA-binding transcriptional ArsR family regulator
MRRSSKVSAKANSSTSLFAALGEEVRLRIVSRLCDGGSMSITKLTAGSTVTRQAIIRHLRLMEEAGLLRMARA